MQAFNEWLESRQEEILEEGSKEWLISLLLSMSPALTQAAEPNPQAVDQAKMQMKRLLIQQIDTLDVDDLKLKMQHASDFGKELNKPMSYDTSISGKKKATRLRGIGDRVRSQPLRQPEMNPQQVKNLKYLVSPSK